jgi:hypothetical protein
MSTLPCRVPAGDPVIADGVDEQPVVISGHGRVVPGERGEDQHSITVQVGACFGIRPAPIVPSLGSQCGLKLGKLVRRQFPVASGGISTYLFRLRCPGDDGSDRRHGR